MAVFDSIRTAVLRAEGTVIQESFSSSDQVAVEMADLSNEVARDIVEDNNWRALTRIATISGGGTSFPLPDDYLRMAGEVDDPATWFWGYEPFSDVNEWMRYKSGDFLLAANGGWIMLGGRLEFFPAPTGQAQFPYISNRFARSEDGTAKDKFTSDNDTFVLNERLLTLGLIWRWKAQKGMDYAEDMATYEQALMQDKARDRGSYVLRQPRPLCGPIAYTGRPIR